jgi:hypothetical protein
MLAMTKQEIEEMIKESPACSTLSVSDKDEIVIYILSTTLKGGETMEVN